MENSMARRIERLERKCSAVTVDGPDPREVLVERLDQLRARLGDVAPPTVEDLRAHLALLEERGDGDSLVALLVRRTVELVAMGDGDDEDPLAGDV